MEEQELAQLLKAELGKRRRPRLDILTIICILVFAFFIITAWVYKSGDGSLCVAWYNLKVGIYERISPKVQDRFYEMLVNRECP